MGLEILEGLPLGYNIAFAVIALLLLTGIFYVIPALKENIKLRRTNEEFLKKIESAINSQCLVVEKMQEETKQQRDLITETNRKFTDIESFFENIKNNVDNISDVSDDLLREFALLKEMINSNYQMLNNQISVTSKALTDLDKSLSIIASILGYQGRVTGEGLSSKLREDI
jgi:uncharacterized protein YoxC